VNSQTWQGAAPAQRAPQQGPRAGCPNASYLPMGIHELLLQGCHPLQSRSQAFPDLQPCKTARKAIFFIHDEGVQDLGKLPAPFVWLTARLRWIHVQGTGLGMLQPITWESKSMLERNSPDQTDSCRKPMAGAA